MMISKQYLLLVCLFTKQTEARYIFLLPTTVSHFNTFRMSDSELSDFLTESLTVMGGSEMDDGSDLPHRPEFRLRQTTPFSSYCFDS